MERRRIFFSITLHVIISSVVQSCCDTSNGWVDITESSRVGDIIGNIQGHSMTSFKNVRVIFVPRLEISSMLLISHLLLINSHNRMSSLLEVWFLSIPRLYSTRGMCIPWNHHISTRLLWRPDRIGPTERIIPRYLTKMRTANRCFGWSEVLTRTVHCQIRGTPRIYNPGHPWMCLGRVDFGTPSQKQKRMDWFFSEVSRSTRKADAW